MSRKQDLKITALTQRIGEITARYENDLADFRAEATVQMESLGEELKRLQERLYELESDEVVEEKSSNPDS